MSSTPAVSRWLSLRVRLLCITVFLASTLLPVYVPQTTGAVPGDELAMVDQQFLLVEEGFLMKTSSLSGESQRRAYAEGIVHVVKAGDTVERLAERYDISAQTIQWANKLDDKAILKPGQELVILPVDGLLHKVSRGQTLIRIAELYGIPADQIASQNRIQGGFILAGQELIIPGGKPIVAAPTVVAVTPPKPAPKPGTPAKPAAGVKTPPANVVIEETAGVLQKPCSGKCGITQYFHPGHYALDMQERGGGPIFAAEAGTVIRAETGWNGGYGNVIEIDHGNGLVTLYGHNKELYVKEGDSVARGQNISWMGNTGLVYGKTGIHVHFEVQKNGVKKNPLLYIQ